VGGRTEERLLAEARVREAILHELTRAAQGLVKEEATGSINSPGPSAEKESSSSSSSGVGVGVKVALVDGERDAGVRDLCLAVEQACLHGIKTQVNLVG
jgi:hypothetical protein